MEIFKYKICLSTYKTGFRSKSKVEKKENKDLINRKEAIEKIGIYDGLTAFDTFMLVPTKKAAQNSQPSGPGLFCN